MEDWLFWWIGYAFVGLSLGIAAVFRSEHAEPSFPEFACWTLAWPCVTAALAVNGVVAWMKRRD